MSWSLKDKQKLVGMEAQGTSPGTGASSTSSEHCSAESPAAAFFFHVLKCLTMVLESLTNTNYFSLRNLDKLSIYFNFLNNYTA